MERKVISLNLRVLLQWMQPTLGQNYLENTCTRAKHMWIFDLFAPIPQTVQDNNHTAFTLCSIQHSEGLKYMEFVCRLHVKYYTVSCKGLQSTLGFCYLLKGWESVLQSTAVCNGR